MNIFIEVMFTESLQFGANFFLYFAACVLVFHRVRNVQLYTCERGCQG